MKPNTIFVVDDCPDSCAIIRFAAEAGGIRCDLRIAPDGREALNILDACSSPGDFSEHSMPSLLLLDLNMPGLHGFEVLSAIRERVVFAGLPVVIFSTSDDPADVRKAYALGADGYLVKPMEFDDLIEVLKSLDLVATAKPSSIVPLQELPVFRSAMPRTRACGYA